MTGFSVQADALAQQAVSYEGVAQQIAAIQQQAASDAATYDGSWGDDEAGAFFAMTYSPTQNKALDQLAQAAKAVQDMADTTQRWAQSYPDTDANLR